MKFNNTILENSVGRKILMRFLLAALLPMLLFAYVTYTYVAKQTQSFTYKELQRHSETLHKTLEVELSFLGNKLKSFSEIYRAEDKRTLKLFNETNPHAKKWFQNIVYVSPTGAAKVVFGKTNHRALSKALIKKLKSNHAGILTRDYDNNIYLVENVKKGTQRSHYFMATLQKQYFEEIFKNLPHNTLACLTRPNHQTLICSGNVNKKMMNQISLKKENDSLSELMFDNKKYYLHYFDAHTDKVNQSDLMLAVASPTPALIQEFLFYFPLLIALSLLALVLFTIGQIRRLLIPLDKLKDATKNVLNKSISDQIDNSNTNEFEYLSSALKKMGDRLNKHISTLETMSNIDKVLLKPPPAQEICAKEKLDPVIANMISIEKMVETVLFQMKKIVACNNISVAITEKHTLRDATHYFIDNKDPTKIKSETIAMQAWHRDQLYENPESLLLANDENTPRYLFTHDAKYKYYLLLPIFTEKDLSAIIILYFEDKPEHTDEELEQAKSICHRISVALCSLVNEDKLYRKAHFDPLTDLPNRLLFQERLYYAMQQASRHNHLVALMFIDLDHFKDLNDMHGHSAGDEFLIEIANRMKSCVADTDTVARLGGDEFTIILPSIPFNDDHLNEISKIAQNILKETSSPFLIGGESVKISVSIGISIYPQDCDNISDLLRQADHAMYQAKNHGKSDFQFYAGGKKKAGGM